jgi:hypothetical protein
MEDPRELEGYEEIMEKFQDLLPPEQRRAFLFRKLLRTIMTPEQRMTGLTPEQRMANLTPKERLVGLTPEQRMDGLPPEQILLALPNYLLRGFSDEVLATLSDETRAAIRWRIGPW